MRSAICSASFRADSQKKMDAAEALFTKGVFCKKWASAAAGKQGFHG